MSLHLALEIAGLASAAFLVLGRATRALGAIALVAGAVEVAMAYGVLRLSLTSLPLGLVLALCLAVPGALAWLRSPSKPGITAATVVTLVGVLQLIEAVGRRL